MRDRALRRACRRTSTQVQNQSADLPRRKRAEVENEKRLGNLKIETSCCKESYLQLREIGAEMQSEQEAQRRGNENAAPS